MRTVLTILTLVLVMAGGGVAAGPFGLEMGQRVDPAQVEGKLPKFSFRSVPTPHPLFTHYSGWASEATGLCRILAATKEYDNDAYGEKVRTDFVTLREALARKYGKERRIETLKPKALWDEARYWVMSLRQNERTHAADWEMARAAGESYALIQLWIVGLSNDASMIVLEYRSSDFAACNKAIEDAANGSL